MKPLQNYSPSRFFVLVSLKPAEFTHSLATFTPMVETYFQYHTHRGEKRIYPAKREVSHSSLYGAELKLFFINNSLKQSVGAFFCMSQGKVSQWVKVLLNLLYQALQHEGLMPCEQAIYFENQIKKWRELNPELVLIQDATRPIARAVNAEAQKHTMMANTNDIRF